MTAEELRREHLSAVAEIEAECFAEPWSERALELLLTEQAFGAVCVKEGRVVAYGGVFWAPDEGQITNIAVREDCRRCGCGGAILKELKRAALTSGCIQLSLEVRASNQAAVALYERHGFAIAGIRKRFYKNPCEDALVMLCDLTRPHVEMEHNETNET